MPIPKEVRSRLEWHIGTIQRLNEDIQRLRELGKRVGSPGRYEWEFRTTTCPDPEPSMVFFKTFEELARKNGIDPEAVYQEYGGKPEPEPWSDDALAWLK